MSNAQDQAQSQYDSIVTMLAAADVDWSRLEELRDTDAEDLTPEEAAELAQLEETAGDCEDEDDARQRIEEDALSVEVRSDWATPGEELTAGEFRITLCTGGPAVQIRGELNEHGEPTRAWLEYQDWGTPWTQFYGAKQSVLIRYVSCFLGA